MTRKKFLYLSLICVFVPTFNHHPPTRTLTREKNPSQLYLLLVTVVDYTTRLDSLRFNSAQFQLKCHRFIGMCCKRIWNIFWNNIESSNQITYNRLYTETKNDKKSPTIKMRIVVLVGNGDLHLDKEVGKFTVFGTEMPSVRQ